MISGGHGAGDTVLLAVANHIRGVMRDSHVACRMGGDRFVLPLSGIADRDATTHVAKKLIAAIVAPVSITASTTGEQQAVDIGASIGICLYPEDGRELETLLSGAGSQDVNRFAL